MKNKILKGGRPSTTLAKHVLDLADKFGCKAFAKFESKHLDKTTDIATGDFIVWFEPYFSSRFRGADLLGYTPYFGEVKKESYGSKSAQHTFTIEVYNLSSRQKVGEINRKGRTIYGNAFLVERRATADELDEKHSRGLSAKISALEGWLHDNPTPSIKRDRKVSELERFKGMQTAIDKYKTTNNKEGK